MGEKTINVTQAQETTRKFRFILLRGLSEYGGFLALIMLIIVFGILKPRHFLSIKNLSNIVQQVALFGIVAIGLTYPLAMKEFDLSVGYIACLGGVFVIKMFQWGLSELWAILFTLILLGILAGVLNGLIVAKMRVPSLVVTIGTGFLFFGMTMLLTGGARLFYDIPPSFGIWGVPPVSLYILGGIIAVSYIILHRTGLGRYIYAIGNNEQASYLAGVNTSFMKLFAFIMCGTFACLAGIMLSSQVMCGDPVGANRYLMHGLAAAYIGTGVFKKGEANIPGTVVGALIIGVAYNGTTLIGVPYALREAITGVILITALVASGRKAE